MAFSIPKNDIFTTFQPQVLYTYTPEYPGEIDWGFCWSELLFPPMASRVINPALIKSNFMRFLEEELFSPISRELIEISFFFAFSGLMPDGRGGGWGMMPYPILYYLFEVIILDFFFFKRNYSRPDRVMRNVWSKTEISQLVSYSVKLVCIIRLCQFKPPDLLYPPFLKSVDGLMQRRNRLRGGKTDFWVH